MLADPHDILSGMEWEELEAIERGCNHETCLKDVAIVQEELVGTHSEAVRWRGGEKKEIRFTFEMLPMVPQGPVQYLHLLGAQEMYGWSPI